MSDVRKTIGGNIRSLRKDRGLTLVQLGKCLHVSYQQMQKYEKGVNTMPVDKLVAIAFEFGCTLDELCGFGGVQFSPEAERILLRIVRLQSPKQRRTLLDLVEVILDASEAVTR